ncbi:hypothetical protein [Streptomyces sp. NPDC003023]|uniref:hypothetical protein n=1 Tax=Streptomyces sp. NPDC003023 TaxID=3364675 RepID=UPI0036C54678
MLVISQDGRASRELTLAGGLSPNDVRFVHREALRVLRPGIDTAHTDAYSDDTLPSTVLHSYERLVALGLPPTVLTAVPASAR